MNDKSHSPAVEAAVQRLMAMVEEIVNARTQCDCPPPRDDFVALESALRAALTSQQEVAAPVGDARKALRALFSRASKGMAFASELDDAMNDLEAASRAPVALVVEPEHWDKLRKLGWRQHDCKVCGESWGAMSEPETPPMAGGAGGSVGAQEYKSELWSLIHEWRETLDDERADWIENRVNELIMLIATPAAGAGGSVGAVPEGYALVPVRLTQEMDDVIANEGWQWEDLLAAAGAITQTQYDEITERPPIEDSLTQEDAIQLLCVRDYLEANNVGDALYAFAHFFDHEGCQINPWARLEERALPWKSEGVATPLQPQDAKDARTDSVHLVSGASGGVQGAGLVAVQMQHPGPHDVRINVTAQDVDEIVNGAPAPLHVWEYTDEQLAAGVKALGFCRSRAIPLSDETVAGVVYDYMTAAGPKRPLTIYMDEDPIDVEQFYRAKGFEKLPATPTMTGQEIRDCGWKKQHDNQMFIDHGNTGIPFEPIGTTQAVILVDGMRFVSIPAATWGGGR